MERVRNHHVAAVRAGRAQVVQPLQVAALALPVADCVVDKLKLTDVAEVGNRKHRGKHRLEAVVLALLGQLLHLQNALAAEPLHFNHVRNLDRRRNLRKIKTAANRAHLHARGVRGCQL